MIYILPYTHCARSLTQSFPHDSRSVHPDSERRARCHVQVLHRLRHQVHRGRLCQRVQENRRDATRSTGSMQRLVGGDTYMRKDGSLYAGGGACIHESISGKCNRSRWFFQHVYIRRRRGNTMTARATYKAGRKPSMQQLDISYITFQYSPRNLHALAHSLLSEYVPKWSVSHRRMPFKHQWLQMPRWALKRRSRAHHSSTHTR